MDTAIRTLRPETSKRQRPNALAIPVQQEVARKTSASLFPKSWAFPLLRGPPDLPLEKPVMQVRKQQ